MSKISYPRLVNDIADAYRTASNTANRVKYGELPQRIAQLPTGPLNPTDNGTITADTQIDPSAFVRLDISFANLSLTGAVNGKASIGSTLGLTCSDFDISAFDKQWLHYLPEDVPENMIASQANEVLCKLSGRVYKKSRNGAAYVGYMYNSAGYTGPLLVSKVSEDAVIFNAGGADQYSAGTVQYLGETYWYGSGGYWMGGDVADASGLNRYRVPATTTIEAGVLMLLDAVGEYTWKSIEGENADTYHAAGEYNKIRCAVTGTGNFVGTIKSGAVIIE